MAKRLCEYSDDDLYHLLFKDESIAESAFSEIYDRCSSKVFTFCHYFIGNYDDASDVLQETFIKFYNSKKPERVMTNMTGYLIIIARNLCLSQCKDAYRVPDLEDYKDFFYGETNYNDEKLYKKMAPIIKDAVQQLSESYKEIFILREYDGLSYKEIAEVLGENIDNIKVRIYRAKKQLRKILEPQIAYLELEED